MTSWMKLSVSIVPRVNLGNGFIILRTNESPSALQVQATRKKVAKDTHSPQGSQEHSGAVQFCHPKPPEEVTCGDQGSDVCGARASWNNSAMPEHKHRSAPAGIWNTSRLCCVFTRVLFQENGRHGLVAPLPRVRSTLTQRLRKATPSTAPLRDVTEGGDDTRRLAPPGGSGRSARSHARFPALPAGSLPLRRRVPERASRRQLGAPLPR